MAFVSLLVCLASCRDGVDEEETSENDGGSDSGVSCDDERLLCDEFCVDVEADPANCGSCGRLCASDEVCWEAECQEMVGDCRQVGCVGFTYCNPASGQCLRGCDSNEQCWTREVCATDTHECTCDDDSHRCAGTCVSNDSTESCGDRCEPCLERDNATATCEDGRCGFDCDDGFHECDDECLSDDDVESCGDRCELCPAPSNATPTCLHGDCDFTCDEGYHRHGDQCDPDCDDGSHLCGWECMSDDDVETCGDRCEPCPVPPHASATCDGRRCGFECNSGYHNCSGDCVSNDDVDTCGDRCAPCPDIANGWPDCVDESCVFECSVDFALCGDTCVDCPPGALDCCDWIWVEVSTVGAPAARHSHVAIWTGEEMIVWGGSDGDPWTGDLSDGGVYDPATDTWSPISEVGAPFGRTDATAVWTGEVMIVWGGGDSGLDTGGIYDPMTDRWTETSLDGAPEARTSHTAIWTGEEMIIWGGHTGYASTGWDLRNDGGRYDPATDTWSPVTLDSAPGARHRHIAIWTGEEMIVWGGFPGDWDGAGGRYDPATDTWVAMTTVDAPVNREWTSVVWTGLEMIVWSGVWSTYTDSGGRYDPATDTWTSTETAGAPIERSRHTAVWTGEEMIVWGGGAPPGLEVEQLTGGRYNPSTDHWSPTTLLDAPSDRDRHTALWTGSAMIVWGGVAWSPTNTGGRYINVTM